MVAMERYLEAIGSRSIRVGSDDLEWHWMAWREESKYSANLRNQARIVWPRTNKFGRERYF